MQDINYVEEGLHPQSRPTARACFRVQGICTCQSRITDGLFDTSHHCANPHGRPSGGSNFEDGYYHQRPNIHTHTCQRSFTRLLMSNNKRHFSGAGWIYIPRSSSLGELVLKPLAMNFKFFYAFVVLATAATATRGHLFNVECCEVH
jgi:hypothetical protein